MQARPESAAGITAPVGNLLGDKAMATRDIYNPDPGLKAFRHDLCLHMIRPAPDDPPRRHKRMTSANTVHTIRHAIPPSAAGNLLAASDQTKTA